jgi:outer membrane lipoprotein SlyB
MTRFASHAAILVAALASSGAALAQGAVAQPSAKPPAQGVCADCGVVLSVRQVEQKGGSSGAGLVVGGVVGGVLGHQIGSGRGNTAATIVGAGAGAYAGNEVEKNRNTKTSWSVAIRMDNGQTRTYTYSNPPAVRDGDRVKLVDGGKRLALLAN